MKRSLAAVIAAGLFLLVVLPDPALAGGIDVRSDSSGATASVQTSGGGGAGGGGAGPAGPSRPSPFTGCRSDRSPFGALLHPGSALPTTPGSTYWTNCQTTATGATVLLPQTVGGPPPPPPADVVAAQAASTLQLSLPEVATAPPQGGIQLVGVDVWFWVTNSRPAQATATVPGLSATVTAAPVATHLEFADGSRVDCAGGGSPYDRTRPGREQRSTCARVFRDRGQQRVNVTVDWAISWTASTGEAGVLPAVGRTTTLVLAVQEGQAVTD
jgi:hypothetical protein